VNAIGNSSYWSSTVVIVVWDDWGGFYDSVPPPSPRDNQGGPGFRVPMLVVSPYVKIGSGSQGGYISNTTYEFASIIRFIEDNFKLGRIPGTPDAKSASIADMLDLTQSPRSFTTIPSHYTKSFFLHQKPSELPVDTE
jgi:phospholipase C